MACNGCQCATNQNDWASLVGQMKENIDSIDPLTDTEGMSLTSLQDAVNLRDCMLTAIYHDLESLADSLRESSDSVKMAM